jgi:PEP-CTERM motif
MKLKTLSHALLACAVLIGTIGHTNAATVAFDDASSSAYNSGWNTGTNGGFGFSAWTIQTAGNAGTFMATLGAANSNQMHEIETSGEAWGTYANGAGFQGMAAFRSFTGGSLSVGQVFDFAVENGSIQNGGTMGVTLRNGSASSSIADYNAAARFELLFTGGTSNYTLIDGAGSFDTAIPFSNAGLDVHFALTGIDSYNVEIYSHGTNTTYNFNGRTLGGTAGTGLDSFAFYNRDTENADVFFNSVAVTPEPSRMMLLGFGLMGLMFRRRR